MPNFDWFANLFINEAKSAIEASEGRGGSGGSGDAIMDITFTPIDEEDKKFNADRSFEELLSAKNEGKILRAIIFSNYTAPVILPLTTDGSPYGFRFSTTIREVIGGSISYIASIDVDNNTDVRVLFNGSTVHSFYVEVDTTVEGYVYSNDDFDFLAEIYTYGTIPNATFYRSVDGKKREDVHAHLTSVKYDGKQFTQMTFTTIVDGNKLITLTYDKDSPNNEVIYNERILS